MSKNKQLKDLPAGRSLAIINRKMCQPYLGLDKLEIEKLKIGDKKMNEKELKDKRRKVKVKAKRQNTNFKSQK